MAPPPAPSERGPARAPAKAPVGLALGLLVATTFEVFGGEASVDVSAAGVVVEANTTLWPAWVGLALAIVAGLATLVPVLTAYHPCRGAALPVNALAATRDRGTALPAAVDRRFEAVVFDWDETAVPDRNADTSELRGLIEELCRTGLNLAVGRAGRESPGRLPTPAEAAPARARRCRALA